MKHGKLWMGFYAAALTAFTIYTLMDTFTISRVYTVVEAEAASTTAAATTATTTASDDSDSTTTTDSSSTTTADSTTTTDSSTTTDSTATTSDSQSGYSITSKTTASGDTDTTTTGTDETTTASSDSTAETTSTAAEAAAASTTSTASTASTTDTTTAADTTSTDSTGTTDTVVSTLSDAEVISTDSYSDDNISIVVTTYYWNSTMIYAADITVSSPEYLQTAFAQGAYGKNVTAATSTIASDAGAILAINGDYYGAQESGYVIRNGVLYRSTSAGDQEDLVIYSDGTFEIINESDVTAEELLADGAQQVLSFGPGLIEDGEIAVTVNEETGKAKASNPRTAIGMIDTCHYVMVVSDGRTSESAGLSLYELAEFMQSLGVQTAYNLDGGGSSTMYFQGEVINNPTTDGRTIKERKVSDIVYIG